MEQSVYKALNDKIYDRRKNGALELEGLVREALLSNDFERIQKIVKQLCNEFAYAVHQPHARNGGLIGLAAASIALGSEVARYLEDIVPPVLACFVDQDARVRYYACESMYNIAKVAKGEILLYFNEIFDVLCKLAADNELSVKNGAELLDRLIKDIVSESAASYVSVLSVDSKPDSEIKAKADDNDQGGLPTTFSLPRFIPLLQERINVINPFTRIFLVNWILLLDSIPDLELVSYLPSFLRGLFKFLSDPNQEVHSATQGLLKKMLAEIKDIARIKRDLAASCNAKLNKAIKPSTSSANSTSSSRGEDEFIDHSNKSTLHESPSDKLHGPDRDGSDSQLSVDDIKQEQGDDWQPGQDIQIDHLKILEILLSILAEPCDVEIQVNALRWIDGFFDVSPEDIQHFVPKLLGQVLPALSNDVDDVRQAAVKVNASLMDYIISLSEDQAKIEEQGVSYSQRTSAPATNHLSYDHNEPIISQKSEENAVAQSHAAEPEKYVVKQDIESLHQHGFPPVVKFNYDEAIDALTLQFLNKNEATRVASLAWLTMLQSKAPRKIQATSNGTFPALLKTLSDPSEAVVMRDLMLISQISKHSDEGFFKSFMLNLLKLFSKDRRLLEHRGNLIVRQLCVHLSADRIYRTLAECLERDEDTAFASFMIQTLSNNLITAPELSDLRKRLRNLDLRDGQTLFVALFRSWCHNAVATFSLCLLAQAYEQAYNLLQIFADLEINVTLLIQIDKLVQLLESPVFTYLRLQLLEPDKFPYLYRCLYGLLMLLPQSSAFAALKNRLSSVSGMGYLQIIPRSGATTPGSSNFERPNRFKSRDEGAIRWMDLLEKFRLVQERTRKLPCDPKEVKDVLQPTPSEEAKPAAVSNVNVLMAQTSPASSTNGGRQPHVTQGHSKPKSTLSTFGRFTSGVGGRRQRK